MSSEKVIENEDKISIKRYFATNKIGDSDISLRFNPLSYFDSTMKRTSKTALLILNQTININIELFSKLWELTDLKVCADGGLNRLRNFDESFVPDYVIGDLDSAKQSNIDYYKSRGTQVILQDSQYCTDFQKSTCLINIHCNHAHILDEVAEFDTIDGLVKKEEELGSLNNDSSSHNQDIQILLLGGVGGRFDQTMATINQIWRYSVTRPQLQFVMINPEHLEFIILLKEGCNLIDYPKLDKDQELLFFGHETEKSRPGLRNVGLLPIMEPAVISTHGLKWDVLHWETDVKSKMSSSNLQVGNEGFIIETNKPLFLTLEL